MRGILLIGSLLAIWIFTGMYNDHQINTQPYVSDQDDIGVMSGYNHMHVIIEEKEFVQLDVYNPKQGLRKTYLPKDLQKLYPAGVFVGVEENNEKLFVIYKNNENKPVRKKLVVGVRGTIQFAQERN